MKENVIKSYFNTAIELIRQYSDEASQKFTPLNLFLKAYFKKHSKYGKRDRNAISELIYAYFRVGNTFSKSAIEDRILLGSVLCATEESGIHYFFTKSKLSEYEVEADVKKRIQAAQKHFSSFDPDSFFPFPVEFSDGISREQYFHSFLQKPSTFIRVIKNQKEKVIHDLQKNEIAFEEVTTHENALKINSSKNLNDLDSWKKGMFEIQDLSSQQTVNFLHPKQNDEWWDVCAASGGKSLLLLSKEKNIFIQASDVRKNILENYKERVKRTGFLNFKTEIIDASERVDLNKKFDGIICDVPCSGSGTWHRTPENLFFFTEDTLKHYCSLQKRILENAVGSIKPGKPFIYITCSAFKMENEGNMPASSVSHEVINNLDKGADCMFIATTV